MSVCVCVCVLDGNVVHVSPCVSCVSECFRLGECVCVCVLVVIRCFHTKVNRGMAEPLSWFNGQWDMKRGEE